VLKILRVYGPSFSRPWLSLGIVNKVDLDCTVVAEANSVGVE